MVTKLRKIDRIVYRYAITDKFKNPLKLVQTSFVSVNICN